MDMIDEVWRMNGECDSAMHRVATDAASSDIGASEKKDQSGRTQGVNDSKQ